MNLIRLMVPVSTYSQSLQSYRIITGIVGSSSYLTVRVIDVRPRIQQLNREYRTRAHFPRAVARRRQRPLLYQ
jgi:hypothetical protein